MEFIEINPENIKCDGLIQTTLNSMDDEKLRLLLVLTQQANLEKCMRNAFDRYECLNLKILKVYGT